MKVKTKISKKILDEILRYRHQKDKLDSYVNLSADNQEIMKLSVDKVSDSTGYMTLLSEGSVLYKDGTIRMFITKGTLTNFYNSLDDTYEGYVTTGHVSTDSFPIREGYFKKEDLKLVTDSNGRSDLLVKPHINLELSTIKDLMIQDEPFAISSEFLAKELDITDGMLNDYAKLVKYNTELGGDTYFPIVDEVDIKGFSFVANPGNAKSGGYDPSMLKRNEEERLNRKETLDNILNTLSQKVNSEEVSETQEEVKEEVKETNEEVTETKEEAKKGTEELAETLDKAIKSIEQLEQENKTLKEELASYKEEEKEMNEKLEKLNVFLSKVDVTPVVNETKEKTKGVFGRARFGGLNNE